MNELVGSGLGGLWVIPALEWAKRTNLSLFRWVTDNNARYVSLLVAMISAMGMHFQFDPASRDWHLHGNINMMVHGVVQFTVSHWGHKFYIAARSLQRAEQLLAEIASRTLPITSAPPSDPPPGSKP